MGQRQNKGEKITEYLS